VGGTLAAHGAQKVFGWFGGQGLIGPATGPWTPASPESPYSQPVEACKCSAGTSAMVGTLWQVMPQENKVRPDIDYPDSCSLS